VTAGRLWARLALSAVLLGGLSVGAVLTRHHENKVYGDASATLSNCPQTETVNCDTVNTSAWSELLGVPIAAFAIPTYLLVLVLIWAGGPADPWLAYAFCIGLLTTLASGFLFYVSKTQIGFICLYCVSLYGVNVSIPLLTAWAARRSPLSLVRGTLADLAGWPRALRVTTALFVALLTATIGLQQAYRLHVERAAAAERQRIEDEGGPLVPAGPTSGSLGDEEPGTPSLFVSEAVAAPLAPQGSAPASAYTLAGPLRRIAKGSKAAPFDLQAKIGHGRPVALLFWYPGYRESERFLMEMSEFLGKQASAFDVYSVAGKREDDRDEGVLESAAMLGVPDTLPLLIDDKFAVSTALNTTDVPNLALFDTRGRLVVAKIKALDQKLIVPEGNLTAEQVIRKVASGAEVAEIKQMFPYYPATELYGRCAPEFAAKKFDTQEVFKFAGRPSGDKPMLLMFWSSTCKHCQVEVPLLVSWVKRHPGQVEVLSVTHIKQDQPGKMSHREITKRYIKDKQIPWTVLEDPDDAIGEVYHSISTPTTYFLTPKGAVVHAWFYPHETGFDQAMEQALSQVKNADARACLAVPPAPAPRLTLDMLGPDGKKLTLASQLDRPAIVHFWATWCAPCMEEIPALLRFGQSLEKSGAGRLVMLSVEDAASGDKIAGFAKKYGLALRSNRAPSGPLADALDLSYRLPRTFVVAPNGVLVAARQGSQKWDDPQVDERVMSRLRNAAALAQ
jgi:thiol-disulfide isomerase/thioredoxin/uncharacterized membrane protein